MRKSKKYFTFLYVPSKNSGLKTIRIPKLLAWGGVGAVALLVAASTLAVMRYTLKAGDTYQVARLTRENEALHAQLAEISQDMVYLEGQVRQNFDFQKKARLLANLDDLNEDITEVGVGGPDFGYVRSLSVLDESTRLSLGGLRSDVDKLIRQARLQSESYGEIVDILTENQQRLNGTPSIRPVSRGFVSSRFGRRMDPITGRSSRHRGVDYSARLGTPILATADGIVTFAGKWAEFGNTVEVSHGNDYVTRYAHASKILVKKGQRVKRGDVIARVGSSGRSTATHLHYEVVCKGVKKNPLAYVLSGQEVTE
ncbi:MAG: M23 family metallopeptidase [Candidatus Krumholzibacteria bacterium]|nr:M23 family metallopeptidase [Candidatus Krumholzibacteria bacterium]